MWQSMCAPSKEFRFNSPADAPQDLEVRGEIVFVHADFERLNNRRKNAGLELFANPRNAASGNP